MALKARLLSAAALACAGVAAPVLAQSEGETSATTDVIVVTAQKREQSLADVPINLTAYDGERLQTLGVQQFDELSDFVPGLEVQEQSPNNPGFVIRGITSDDGAATGEARVAVFQDGVSIARARGAYIELFDIERVEVAKGPQATLFGRGALIGAINVIQNKADLEEVSGAAHVGFGDFGRFEMGGHLNVPLCACFAVRVAATHTAVDGYVDNALGGDALNAVDVSAIRLAARWEPTPDLRFDLIGNFQDDNPIGGASFKSGTIPPTPGGSLEPWEPAALNTFGGFEDDRPLSIDRQVYGATLLSRWDINEAWSINAITGWRGFEAIEIFDPDGFAAELLVVAEDATGKQWSQEFRLNYDDGDRIQAFVGASYFYETGQQRLPLATNEPVAQAFQAPLIAAGAGFTVAQIEGLLAQLGVPNASGFDDPFNPLTISVPAFLSSGAVVPLRDFYLEQTANRGETTAFDIFGDITVSVTERLDLTAGLRWTSEEKSAEVYGINILGPNNITFADTLFIPSTNNQTFTSGDRDFDDFTWRLVATYALSDIANVWASYARGRRPDVISFDSNSPDNFVVAPAEIVDSFEVGGFWTLANTTLSGSVFYSEYENFQTGRFEPNQATFVTDNAGRATQYGFEGQLEHRFNTTLAAFATYAYNFAEFDDTDEDGNTQEFAGNSFRLSPEHAISLGLLAEFDLANFGTLSLVPTYVWQSEVFFDNDNDLTDAVQDERQDSYGLAKLRVRFDNLEETFYAELFANNLFDEDYIIDAGNTGDSFGIPTFIAGPPRMIGARIGVNF